MNSAISSVRIEIGGDYDGDSKATVYVLDADQYEAYSQAETALAKAKVARDKALGTPVRFPVGICSFWILNIRLTKEGNQYIPEGTEGDMHVIETSVDRRVIKALFYPKGSNGFGEVTWPHWLKI